MSLCKHYAQGIDAKDLEILKALLLEVCPSCGFGCTTMHAYGELLGGELRSRRIPALRNSREQGSHCGRAGGSAVGSGRS